MFTKRDFIDYFSEIKRLETDALRNQAALAAKLKNPELRKTLSGVIADEVRHVALTEKLLEIAKSAKG